MSQILGLWSLTLQPGTSHTVTISPNIKITNVSFGENVTGKERSVVTLKYPEFESDDEDESDSESEESEDDDDEEKIPAIVTKETVIAVLKPDVTEQVTVDVSLVEDTEIVELAATGPNEVYLLGHYFDQHSHDHDEYGSEYDSEFDSEDEDSDSDEEIDSDEADVSDESEPRIEEIEEDEEEEKAPKENKKRPAEEEEEEKPLSKAQKKKLAKKQKAESGEAVAAPAVQEEQQEEEKPKSRTLEGGLIITDHKIGTGPVAKKGSKVGMRYIGKLANGKQFDSNVKGAPFTFVLGRNSVIAGWEKGILGMAVGGERKLVIPASLGYGKKGVSGIPGNSTLHFDVKLVSLK